MDQDQFKKALAKFEARKKKQAAAALAESEGRKPDEPIRAVDRALPFLEKVTVPKKEKPIEAPRKPLPQMKLKVEGPVNFEMVIDYQGTLLGSQITEEYLKPAMKKALTVIGRVH